MTDSVNQPPHYITSSLQMIQVVEAFGLGFHLGNVIKYVLRSDKKGSQLEDLKKARWYLTRAIQVLEDDQAADPPLLPDAN